MAISTPAKVAIEFIPEVKGWLGYKAMFHAGFRWNIIKTSMINKIPNYGITLGMVLKYGRTKNGITLRDVEKSTGISNPYLSQLENDKINNPSAKILFKLVNYYNMDINYVMSIVGE